MYKKTRTHFTKKIRIKPEQLVWLKENKDTRTVAGYLDKIINQHKDGNSKSTLSNQTGFIVLESKRQEQKKEGHQALAPMGYEARKEWC